MFPLAFPNVLFGRGAGLTSPADTRATAFLLPIFTYSKSPGLLSMPAFGGAIQDSNLPGSVCAAISEAMKSPSSGGKMVAPHLGPLRVAEDAPLRIGMGGAELADRAVERDMGQAQAESERRFFQGCGSSARRPWRSPACSRRADGC